MVGAGPWSVLLTTIATMRRECRTSERRRGPSSHKRNGERDRLGRSEPFERRDRGGVELDAPVIGFVRGTRLQLARYEDFVEAGRRRRFLDHAGQTRDAGDECITADE